MRSKMLDRLAQHGFTLMFARWQYKAEPTDATSHDGSASLIGSHKRPRAAALMG
jgi:hypothetical protein